MLYRNHIHVNFRAVFNLLILSLFTATWAIPVSAQLLNPVASIPPQTITIGTPITPINLPRFTGGSGTLTYSIQETFGNPILPGDLSSIGLAGLIFGLNDPSNTMYSGTITGTLMGTSRDDMDEVDLIYIAEDADGRFGFSTIMISIVDPGPNFANSALIPKIFYTLGSPLTSPPFPEVQSHPRTVTYSTSPDLPPGLTFNDVARTISGTPNASSSTTEYTYTATDSNGATATLTFILEENTVPMPPSGPLSYAFRVGGSTNQIVLPAFTGGNKPVTYRLSSSDPSITDLNEISALVELYSRGISFNANTRTLTARNLNIVQDNYTFYLVATDNENDLASVQVTISFIDLMPSILTEDESSTVVAIKGENLFHPLPRFEATGNTGNLLAIQEVRDYETSIVTSLLGTDDLAAELPAGLDYNASLGVIYGTPTSVQPPTNYIYRVVDDNGSQMISHLHSA